MPTMANLVVKKADNTTNYTFTALSASPGDGGFAQWRGEGVSPALAANLRVKSVWNGPKTARRIEVTGDIPFVETLSGIAQVTARAPVRFEMTVPLNMTTTAAADAAAITVNALATQLIKDTVSSGYSPV